MRNRHLLTVDVGGCLSDASYLEGKTNVSLEDGIFINVVSLPGLDCGSLLLMVTVG
jgi:hypothetical protein